MSLLLAHTDLRMPIGFDWKFAKTPFTPGGTASEEPAAEVVGAAEDAAPAEVLRSPQSRGSVAWTWLRRPIRSEIREPSRPSCRGCGRRQSHFEGPSTRRPGQHPPNISAARI